MQIRAIQTRIFKKNENLCDFLFEHLLSLPEKSILLITSKIVSLSEGRIQKKTEISKKELVAKEADQILGESQQTYITIKDGILIPTAGIDESNSEDGDYILWPTDPYGFAREIYFALKKKYKTQEFGIVLTDSRSSPLRQGVHGIGIAHWGFVGVENHIGKKDLFGQELKYSTTNLVDCLSSAAILVMGESHEACPLALAMDLPTVSFSEKTNKHELLISKENDIFKILFKNLEEK